MTAEPQRLPLHQMEIQDGDGEWWEATQVLGLEAGWVGGMPTSLAAFTSSQTGEVLRGRVPTAEPASSEALLAALEAAKRFARGATPDAPTAFRLVDAEMEDAASVLYHPRPNRLVDKSSLWVPAVEAELMEHFARHPEQLHKLGPRRFEELIASIFRGQGFEVELTASSRDGGVDVIAVQKDDITGDQLHLVQCKRYAPQYPVRVGAVRELLGVTADRKATKGILVTTSFFTSPARKLEEANLWRLALRDYDALVIWLRRSRIA